MHRSLLVHPRRIFSGIEARLTHPRIFRVNVFVACEIMMNCDQCGIGIEQGEEREYRGQVLCEDCYMDALSPVRTCDPWAVHSAKHLEMHSGVSAALTPIQREILDIMRETGGVEPVDLVERLRGRLTVKELEREFSSLRHMEKARGEKRGNRVYLRLWEDPPKE